MLKSEFLLIFCTPDSVNFRQKSGALLIKRKNTEILLEVSVFLAFGTPLGTRTLDTLIKSQVLYHLS